MLLLLFSCDTGGGMPAPAPTTDLKPDTVVATLQEVPYLEIIKAKAQVVAGHKVRLYYRLNEGKEETAVVFFPLNKEEAPQVNLQDE